MFLKGFIPAYINKYDKGNVVKMAMLYSSKDLVRSGNLYKNRNCYLEGPMLIFFFQLWYYI